MNELTTRRAASFLIFSFKGIVVAKLPFVPFGLVQSISHRGLEGDDPTDCSVVSEKGGGCLLFVVGALSTAEVRCATRGVVILPLGCV